MVLTQLILAVTVFAPVGDGSGAQRADLVRRCSAAAPARVPVTLHIQRLDDLRQLAPALARAAYELSRYDVSLELSAIELLNAPAVGRSRKATRHSLIERAPVDGSIHVFVVRDVTRFVVHHRKTRARGLHWRYRGAKRSLTARELIAVNRDAPETTLAHELGHLLGLRHARGATNLMDWTRSDPEIRFDYRQGQRMRKGLTRFQARQHRAGARTNEHDCGAGLLGFNVR